MASFTQYPSKGKPISSFPSGLLKTKDSWPNIIFLIINYLDLKVGLVQLHLFRRIPPHPLVPKGAIHHAVGSPLGDQGVSAGHFI